MNYDTIIIGGGLSGLTAGITLAKAGKRVAILAKGLSRLAFNSGSIDLLGYERDGKTVTHPLEAIARLDDEHPYTVISGKADIGAIAAEAASLFGAAQVNVVGDHSENHFRVTPVGKLRPTWLTLDGFFTSADETLSSLPWRNVTIVNIKGFLDFPMDFVAGNLRQRGLRCDTQEITFDELEHSRQNSVPMRTTSLAAALNTRSAIASLAGQINSASAGSEAVFIPALVGLSDEHAVYSLMALVNKPLRMVATLPPSVPGSRLHTALRKYFISLGGTFLLGSTVKSGVIKNGKVMGISARNMPDQVITAGNYILATGSLNSGGITASYERVYEPVFDLDVNTTTSREHWNLPSMYDFQPYMEFGCVTDADLHAIKDGKPVENLRVIGSLLAGNNSMKLATEGGVSMITALHAAHCILSETKQQ